MQITEEQEKKLFIGLSDYLDRVKLSGVTENRHMDTIDGLNLIATRDYTLDRNDIHWLVYDIINLIKEVN